MCWRKINAMKILRLLVWAVVLIVWSGCQNKKPESIVMAEENLLQDISSIGKEKLSDYGFFKGPLKNLVPAEGVMPYALNSALFSDYAFKKRFVKIPT